MARTARSGSTWRHVKRRTLYDVVGLASVQCSDGSMREGRCVVVYRLRDDGTLWVRPEVEFLDGRFEEVTS